MLPILFSIGPINFYSFGLCLAVGFLIFLFLIYRGIKLDYLDEEKVFDAVFVASISGVLGSRFLFIIEHFDNFGFSLLNWVLINIKPGMSLWGGIGIFSAVFLLSIKQKKLPHYKMLDLITIPTLVLFIFGKLGTFLAGGEVGTPTKLPWGVIFFSTIKRHPVSIYQVILAVLVLVVIIKLKDWYLKKRLPAGSLFYTFVIILSVLLFLIAFLREDVIVIGQRFYLDHLIYLLLIISMSIFLYLRLGRNLKNDLKAIRTKINKTINRAEKNPKLAN